LDAAADLRFVSGECREAFSGHCHGDFLDILGCCGDETLEGDAFSSSEASVAVSVELLGVGERAFDCFLSSFVDGFALRCEP